MGDIAIRVEGLSKRYRIGQREPYKALRDVLTEAMYSPFRRLSYLVLRPSSDGSKGRKMNNEWVWALKDVSFEVRQGEVIGIIGRNGAGKTTLLKILSRITRPTDGYAEVHGRIGSLLEVGTGFHPELTGRENIYLNGAILGMKRAEIDRKFDEIVAFSEIEKFIDTPVKHYSSGMYVRLAFAVAAHLEPEILLVDEVLAVGDIAFQEKCLGKMGEVSRQGRTVLFVSHNMNAVWSLCPKSIWLDAGKLKSQGHTAEIISDYRNAVHSRDYDLLTGIENRRGSGNMRITKIFLQEVDGSSCGSAQAGQPVTFVLEYVSKPGTQLNDVEINLIVMNDRENRLFALTNKVTGDRFTDLPTQGRMKCHVTSLPLVPGEYNLLFSCLIRGELADKVLYAAKFMVTEGDFFGTGRLPERTLGNVLVQNKWQVETISGEAE